MDIVCALRTFLRVAETGSFSAAAIDLSRTQPAVSRQVSALEAHFNTRLVHRTTTSLALTAEGERMIPMALKVIEALEELGDATVPEAGAAGRVRLSLPAPLGLYMSDRLAALLARHPELSIELLFREEPSDLIEAGIDLEVRLGPVTDSSLVCRRIGRTTAFLVAAPAYLEKHAPPRTPEELGRHACISYSRGGEIRSWLFAKGGDDVAVPISPRLVVDNAVAVHRAALAGAGIAILSHILAGPDIEAGRLISLMPDCPPARLPINLTYPSRRNMPLRVRTVIDHLVAAMREDPFMTS